MWRRHNASKGVQSLRRVISTVPKDRTLLTIDDQTWGIAEIFDEIKGSYKVSLDCKQQEGGVVYKLRQNLLDIGIWQPNLLQGALSDFVSCRCW